MQIQNSLEWQSARSELTSNINKLPYDASIRKMLIYIDGLVVELSKLEVEARRTKVKHYTDAQLVKINASIDQVEKIIMLAILML